MKVRLRIGIACERDKVRGEAVREIEMESAPSLHVGYICPPWPEIQKPESISYIVEECFHDVWFGVERIDTPTETKNRIEDYRSMGWKVRGLERYDETD